MTRDGVIIYANFWKSIEFGQQLLLKSREISSLPLIVSAALLQSILQSKAIQLSALRPTFSASGQSVFLKR